MGPLGKRLEKKGVIILAKEEDPLRRILQRLIREHGEFPPVEVRQRHYHPNGGQRTEMDEITDAMFEQGEEEMKVLCQTDHQLHSEDKCLIFKQGLFTHQYQLGYGS